MPDADGLSIQVDANPARTLVRLGGEINLRTSPDLRAKLMDSLTQCKSRLIVDLTEVPYMDSSGVGTLVELKRNVDRNKKTLVLAGMNPRVRGVFEISKLDRFFTIQDKVADADLK